MSPTYIIETREDLSAVKFETNIGRAEAETVFAEHMICPGSANDMLAFRLVDKDWCQFKPMVALRCGNARAGHALVARAERGGDPYAILGVPKEQSSDLQAGVWYICRSIKPVTGN